MIPWKISDKISSSMGNIYIVARVVCTTGVSGAVQTQILGVSTGEMVRDENCERLKISNKRFD